MGDSCIFYNIILKEKNESSSSSSSSSLFIKKSICLSADSTLSDLMSHIKSTMIDESIMIHNDSSSVCCIFQNIEEEEDDDDEKDDDLNDNHKFLLFDCTTYPPKDITYMVHKFTTNIGPNSITLQSLGWFPSAKLYICQVDDEISRESIVTSNIHLLDDFQYNKPTTTTTLSSTHNRKEVVKVDLQGELGVAMSFNNSSTRPLPSQILNAIEGRFNENIDDDDNNHNHSSLKNCTSKRQTDQERKRLIDMRLEELEKKSKKSTKNKKVSDQVRKMLIKSRAEGNKKVNIEDRIYLDVVLLDESNSDDLKNESTSISTSTYMFFSRVATIGKVISDRVGSLARSRDKGAELLILMQIQDNELVYRRVPPTLPLHELISKGYLENFGRVVVRIFKGEIDSIAAGYTESIDLK